MLYQLHQGLVVDGRDLLARPAGARRKRLDGVLEHPLRPGAGGFVRRRRRRRRCCCCCCCCRCGLRRRGRRSGERRLGPTRLARLGGRVGTCTGSRSSLEPRESRGSDAGCITARRSAKGGHGGHLTGRRRWVDDDSGKAAKSQFLLFFVIGLFTRKRIGCYPPLPFPPSAAGQTSPRPRRDSFAPRPKSDKRRPWWCWWRWCCGCCRSWCFPACSRPLSGRPPCTAARLRRSIGPTSAPIRTICITCTAP